MDPALKQAIDRILGASGGGSRRTGANRLSDTYRAGGSSAGVDPTAYLAARLPATLAAAAAVLGEVKRLRPDLLPQSLLDAGSGPGTAAWAGVGCWPDIASVTLLDSHAGFLALARALAANGPPALQDATHVRSGIAAMPDDLAADLVTAAYVLAELPQAEAGAMALHLWRRAVQLLVIAEPGTPAGFARIRAARAALLSSGAVPVGPCPHGSDCPVTGQDWCHFSVRLARSRAHMHAKGARVPFEDEKFSWFAAARTGSPSGGARIIAPPRHGKSGLDLRLCTPDGLTARHAAGRDRPAIKVLRKARWGDLLGGGGDGEDR